MWWLVLAGAGITAVAAAPGLGSPTAAAATTATATAAVLGGHHGTRDTRLAAFTVEYTLGLVAQPKDRISVASSVKVEELIRLTEGPDLTAKTNAPFFAGKELGYVVQRSATGFQLARETCDDHDPLTAAVSAPGCAFHPVELKAAIELPLAPRASAEPESLLGWVVKGNATPGATHVFRLRYTLPNAVHGLAASPYARLRLRALDQRFTPKIAIGATPAELQKPTATTYIRPIALTWQVEVTGWDPVYQYALCGRRRTALYSRSGMDITRKSACAACTIRGYRGSESKGQCFPLTLKPIVSSDRRVFHSGGGKDGSEGTKRHHHHRASSDVGIQVKLTLGTLPTDAGLISFERGGRCRQYLFDQNAPFLDEFFGEITYPLKIILFVTPVGMAAMFLGIGVARLFAVCGPLVAIGSHMVDAAALGGIAVYPVCSIAVVGRFLTLTDLTTILIFSAGCVGAFYSIDQMISRRFTLPQSVLACHCSTWAPLINVMLPAWLPLWMLIAIAYVYGVLCIAIEMCTTAEAVPWIVTVVSWSLAFHLCKALQPRVKEAKRSGKKAEFQVLRIAFLLYFIEPPLTGYWLLLTDPAGYTGLFAGFSLGIGAIIISRLADSGGGGGSRPSSGLPSLLGGFGRKAKLSDASQSPTALDSKMLAKLRPKQRELLQSQLSA